MSTQKKVFAAGVACLVLAAVLVVVLRPVPGPEPKPEGVAVVVIFDPADATDLAVYTDPIIDEYCERTGHQLRVHPVDVVSEKTQDGKPVPPEYLVPYLADAKNRKLPVVLLGKGGKVLSALERPATAQDALAFIEKQLGTHDPADCFYAAGEWRKLSSLKPQKPGAGERWKVEGTDKREPLIPEKDWKDISIANYAVWRTDQARYSSCCPSSGCAMLALVANRSGLKPDAWKMSVMDAYSRIASGDNGAALEDFWGVAVESGVCTTEFCPEQGWSRKPPYKDGYKQSRAKHRALTVTYCPDWEAMASALQRRKPVHYGLLVDGGFTPKNGIIGPKRGRSGGGHALMATGMKKINGEWYILTVNSWGLSWGGNADGTIPKGCALVHVSYLESMFGIFALTSVTSPSDDPIAEKTTPSASERHTSTNAPRYQRDGVFQANGA